MPTNKSSDCLSQREEHQQEDEDEGGNETEAGEAGEAVARARTRQDSESSMTILLQNCKLSFGEVTHGMFGICIT